jgi:hypothetical protein
MDDLDPEHRWLFLAHSYEFSQRVSAFTNEVKHRRNTGLFSRLGLRFLINACFGELG